MKYSVLIRTFNSARTLPNTLVSLGRQTMPPTEYIIVDSGSTDNTLDLLPCGSIAQKYIGNEFNYAEALNQGVSHVSTEYVLIISSHTALADNEAIKFALELLDSNQEIGAAYFCTENSEELKYELIDKNSFDGFNGLWNTCSLIRVSLLRRRGFRSEVFTEDQEWAHWLFHCEGKMTARISGAGMTNNNPRKSSIKKKINEYMAVAYFSNRSLLNVFNIARVGFTVVKPALPFRLRDRYFHLLLFFHLIVCRFVKPESKSRYF